MCTTPAECTTGSVHPPRGGVLGLGFAGYVPLASQSPHPIIVYSVASYRPRPIHFWANAIVIMRADCSLNIKTTAGNHFKTENLPII